MQKKPALVIAFASASLATVHAAAYWIWRVTHESGLNGIGVRDVSYLSFWGAARDETVTAYGIAAFLTLVAAIAIGAFLGGIYIAVVPPPPPVERKDRNVSSPSCRTP